MHFLHGMCRMHLPRRNSQHTAGTRIARQRHGIGHVLRAIAQTGGGRAHGAGQHQGLVVPCRRMRGSSQCLLQKECCFFKRIGAVCEHHGAHIGLCQPMRTALRQCLPRGKVHVFAVKLGHLLTLQGVCAQQILQTRNVLQQVLHIQLCRLIRHPFARMRRLPGNGAACCQNHNLCHFCRTLLQNPKNWLKIQLLDKYPDSTD